MWPAVRPYTDHSQVKLRVGRMLRWRGRQVNEQTTKKHFSISCSLALVLRHPVRCNFGANIQRAKHIQRCGSGNIIRFSCSHPGYFPYWNNFLYVQPLSKSTDRRKHEDDVGCRDSFSEPLCFVPLLAELCQMTLLGMGLHARAAAGVSPRRFSPGPGVGDSRGKLDQGWVGTAVSFPHPRTKIPQNHSLNHMLKFKRSIVCD